MVRYGGRYYCLFGPVAEILILEESTHGAHSIGRVADAVVSRKQSTHTVKCRAERGPTMTEMDGSGPACGVRSVWGRRPSYVDNEVTYVSRTYIGVKCQDRDDSVIIDDPNDLLSVSSNG
jgi:hypothetical protein